MSHLNPRAPTPHGFVSYSRCARCGTERPATGLVFLGDADGVCIPPGVCNAADREWCERQAGKATGVDANGDAVKP